MVKTLGRVRSMQESALHVLHRSLKTTKQSLFKRNNLNVILNILTQTYLVLRARDQGVEGGGYCPVIFEGQEQQRNTPVINLTNLL